MAFNLAELILKLKQSLGVQQKKDIQVAAQALGGGTGLQLPGGGQFPGQACWGDDCAAITDGDHYLLLAAEGMLPDLVAKDPWFAGWCSIMVNVSDVYAMGGRPLAVVDTLWSHDKATASAVFAGMAAASQAYGVPIVGGHTNCHSAYGALSVAILGRATHLLTSFAAAPGDTLVMATDLAGQWHPDYPFWNAATTAEPAQLRRKLEILPLIAELGLCHAAKDISMGGVVGTTLMLLEASGCGALLDLEQVPKPPGASLVQWLINFPSYGFLLSVPPLNVEAVMAQFMALGLACGQIGTIQEGNTLTLRHGEEKAVFWDLVDQPLIGHKSVSSGSLQVAS